MEASHSIDPWAVESDWSDTIQDRVVLETDHCRVVQHTATKAGQWGGHSGFHNDWNSTSFPVTGRFMVSGRPSDGEANFSQVFAPDRPMTWNKGFADMMAEHGEEEILWRYEALDTPTIWRCLYLHVYRSGLYWPHDEDIRQEVYGPGDKLNIDVPEGRVGLLIYLHAKIDRPMEFVTAPYTGSHLLDAGEIRRDRVLSGTVYAVYPAREN